MSGLLQLLGVIQCLRNQWCASANPGFDVKLAYQTRAFSDATDVKCNAHTGVRPCSCRTYPSACWEDTREEKSPSGWFGEREVLLHEIYTILHITLKLHSHSFPSNRCSRWWCSFKNSLSSHWCPWKLQGLADEEGIDLEDSDEFEDEDDSNLQQESSSSTLSISTDIVVRREQDVTRQVRVDDKDDSESMSLSHGKLQAACQLLLRWRLIRYEYYPCFLRMFQLGSKHLLDGVSIRIPRVHTRT